MPLRTRAKQQVRDNRRRFGCTGKRGSSIASLQTINQKLTRGIETNLRFRVSHKLGAKSNLHFLHRKRFDAAFEEEADVRIVECFHCKRARRKPGTSIHLYHKRKLGRGKYKDTLIVVVVKSLEENSERQGFVESALLSDRIMNRLVLEWKQ